MTRSLVIFVWYTCYSKDSKPDKSPRNRPHGADDLADAKFE